MSLISLTTAVLTVLISGNFVFGEPDCSSGDTLVAGAALGRLSGCAGSSSWSFLRQCEFRLRIA
jgi:hypothetical protein